MSDRVRSFVVVLRNDVTMDVAEQLASAVAEMRHVAEVRIGPVVTPEVRRVRTEEKARLHQQLLAMLTPSWARRSGGV